MTPPADDERDDDPGARMDRREKEVLHAVLKDPYPWTVAELERDFGAEEGMWARDAVAALDRAGLVHHFELPVAGGSGRARNSTVEVVIPTRAARRADVLYEESI